jgi:hypothetical protein
VTIRVLAAPAAALLAAVASCGGAKATDIVDVSVVTTLPKEVGPGGFDRTIAANGVASGVFFKAVIADCGEAVDSVASTWAVQHGLVAGPRTAGPRSARLEFTAQAPAGTFTINYTRATESADVRVTFRGSAGPQTLSAADLDALGISALVDALLAAAQCNGGGTTI